MFFQEKHARQRAVIAEQEQARLLKLSVEAEAAERDERRTAQTEASKSQEVAKFLQDMLSGVGPSVALGRDTKLLREILDKTAERVGTELKAQPDVEADLRQIIGDVYAALAESSKAELMQRQAFAIRKALYGDEHPKVADSLVRLAKWAPTFEAAERMLQDALRIRRTRLGEEPPDVVDSMNEIGFLLRAHGQYAKAEALARETLAIGRRFLGEEHPSVAESLLLLAQTVGWQGRAAESESLHREVLEIYKKRWGNDHPDVANSLLRARYEISVTGAAVAERVKWCSSSPHGTCLVRD